LIETAVHGKSKEFEPFFTNILLDTFKTKLFETKTVGELISGYADPLMTIAKVVLPNIIKDNKFSLLNGVTNLTAK
jgi:hypothetical protein